jgi:hypothetical protein
MTRPVSSSKTSVRSYQTTRLYIPGNSHLKSDYSCYPVDLTSGILIRVSFTGVYERTAQRCSSIEGTIFMNRNPKFEPPHHTITHVQERKAENRIQPCVLIPLTKCHPPHQFSVNENYAFSYPHTWCNLKRQSSAHPKFESNSIRLYSVSSHLFTAPT